MRNYKSVGYNYTYILLYITVIGIIYDSIGDFSFAYDNMYYLIVFLFMTINGIVYELYRKNQFYLKIKLVNPIVNYIFVRFYIVKIINL